MVYSGVRFVQAAVAAGTLANCAVTLPKRTVGFLRSDM